MGLSVEKQNNTSNEKKILRVTRTKEEAKESYDKISRYYDFFAGSFEKKYRDVALQQLGIKEGEVVLEIGFGTGHCLAQIAKSVGEKGKAYGIDISSGMLNVTKNRLEKAGVLDKVELHCGDAMNMPFKDDMFGTVFMSFTLELFDTPEIPKVLKKIKRVLKTGGRLGVVSMSKEGKSKLMELYEWAHNKFPKYMDCRPILVEKSIKDAGFQIETKEKVSLLGLPVEIVIGVNTP